VSHELTSRQLEILSWIDRYTTEHGYAPSTRDIAAAHGIASTNGVNDHLVRLAKKGMITRSTMKSRTVVLTDAGRYVVQEDDGLNEAAMVATEAAAAAPGDQDMAFMAKWLRELQRRRAGA